MHKFTTVSGKTMWYDVRTNKISRWSSEVEYLSCPVALFDAPKENDFDNITKFTLEVTQQCNLRCTYCCYSGIYRDRRTHSQKEVSYETLRLFVDFVKSYYYRNSDEILICFYGGEALLARKKMEWVIKELDPILGNRVSYSLSTNGLALTESNIDWICGHENFLVNITIDGDQAMHDAHRKTVGGTGSFNIIINNLRKFREKYPEQYVRRINFLSTVYSLKDIKQLSETWDDYDVLRGHHPIRIGLIIPNLSDHSRVYDTWDVKDDFYTDAFDEYKSGKESIKVDCLRKLTAIIERRNYFPLPNRLMLRTCFQDLFSCFVNVDGDIYACEKFCDEFKMGHLSTGFDHDKTDSILQTFTLRKNKYCQSCWAQRLCRMCLTGLNHTDEEIDKMCDMERDSIDLALKYFCSMADWDVSQKRKM